MTPNQRAIINIAKANEGIVTTKAAIDALGHQYYYNAPLHVGESLSRMVKSGILKRVKRGSYLLLQATSKPVIPNPLQTSLF
jgi:predicted transcriptional regulator of viral defense system